MSRRCRRGSRNWALATARPPPDRPPRTLGLWCPCRPADPAAAHDDLAVVEHRGLAWRRGPDRRLGVDQPAAAAVGLVRSRPGDRRPDRDRPVTDANVSSEVLRRSAIGGERDPLDLE